jgi:hypothetical protein
VDVALDLDKLATLVGDDLRPNERFAAATKCVPKGMIAKQAAFGAFGALGALATPGSNQEVAGAQLPKALVLGLTDQRLFVFKVSQMSGRATSVHASVELTAVAKFDSGKGHTIGLKQLNMTIVAQDGRAISVEVPRVYFSTGQKFADALAAAVPDAVSAAAAEPPVPPPPGLTEVSPPDGTAPPA